MTIPADNTRFVRMSASPGSVRIAESVASHVSKKEVSDDEARTSAGGGDEPVGRRRAAGANAGHPGALGRADGQRLAAGAPEVGRHGDSADRHPRKARPARANRLRPDS